MIRYIGSIVSGLLVSLAIFWLAAFLVQEPAAVNTHKPHTITMPRTLEETDYIFPVQAPITPAWWETREPWCHCCCMCRGPSVPFQNRSFTWPKTEARILAPSHRPARPMPVRVMQQSLLANHWQAAVIDVPYPRKAQADGQEGDVLLQVRLSPDGTVADVAIIRSRANRQLELAAIKAVMEARFDAPVRDGQQVRPLTRRFLIKFRLPAAA